MLKTLGTGLLRAAGGAPLLRVEAAAWAALGQVRTAMWSVEREPQEYKSVDKIIDDALIVKTLEETKEAAKDLGRIKAILEAAKDRSFLKNAEPGEECGRAGRCRCQLAASLLTLPPPSSLQARLSTCKA